jgi:hypothetical protein
MRPSAGPRPRPASAPPEHEAGRGLTPCRSRSWGRVRPEPAQKKPGAGGRASQIGWFRYDNGSLRAGISETPAEASRTGDDPRRQDHPSRSTVARWRATSGAPRGAERTAGLGFSAPGTGTKSHPLMPLWTTICRPSDPLPGRRPERPADSRRRCRALQQQDPNLVIRDRRPEGRGPGKAHCRSCCGQQRAPSADRCRPEHEPDQVQNAEHGQRHQDHQQRRLGRPPRAS